MGEQIRNEKRDEFRQFPEEPLFQEYSLFVEDTAGFSDRRQTFSNLMVAVNALLVAGITVLFKDLGPHSVYRVLTALVLLAAGIAACLIWLKLFSEYKAVIGKRIDFLKRIECEAGKSHKDGMYLMLEKEVYGRENHKRGFTRVEGLLPWVFIGLYSIFMLGTIAVAIFADLWRCSRLLMTCSY